jgi:hypothetical protein
MDYRDAVVKSRADWIYDNPSAASLAISVEEVYKLTVVQPDRSRTDRLRG